MSRIAQLARIARSVFKAIYYIELSTTYKWLQMLVVRIEENVALIWSPPKRKESDPVEFSGNRELASSAEEHDFLQGIVRQYRGSQPDKNGNTNTKGRSRTR
jgi:hypothetical protein